MKLSDGIITIINLTFTITIVMTVIYYFHCLTNRGWSMSNFFLGWHYKNKYKGDKNKEEILVNPLTPMSD